MLQLFVYFGHRFCSLLINLVESYLFQNPNSNNEQHLLRKSLRARKRCNTGHNSVLMIMYLIKVNYILLEIKIMDWQAINDGQELKYMQFLNYFLRFALLLLVIKVGCDLRVNFETWLTLTLNWSWLRENRLSNLV